MVDDPRFRQAMFCVSSSNLTNLLCLPRIQPIPCHRIAIFIVLKTRILQPTYAKPIAAPVPYVASRPGRPRLCVLFCGP